jgi:hypothetical protein
MDDREREVKLYLMLCGCLYDDEGKDVYLDVDQIHELMGKITNLFKGERMGCKGKKGKKPKK